MPHLPECFRGRREYVPGKDHVPYGQRTCNRKQHGAGRHILCYPGQGMKLLRYQVYGDLYGGIYHLRKEDKGYAEGQEAEFYPGEVKKEAKNQYNYSGYEVIPHVPLGLGYIQYPFYGAVKAF